LRGGRTPKPNAESAFFLNSLHWQHRTDTLLEHSPDSEVNLAGVRDNSTEFGRYVLADLLFFIEIERLLNAN